MRRFLQSGSRNLPSILLSGANGTSRDFKSVSGLVNEINRRPISLGPGKSVALQARKTTNLFDGNQSAGSSGRNSSNQNNSHNNNHDYDDNHDNNKPKRGGSRPSSAGRQQASPHDQQEHETTGQKLAKKFGWQSKTSKKEAASTSCGPGETKKSNQDNQFGATQRPPRASSSPSRSSSANNNMKKDEQQRRQTRSSSSSSRPGNEQRDNPSRDHRANGPVRHDKQNQRFVLDLGNNQMARIDYRPLGGQTNKFNLSGAGRRGTSANDDHHHHDQDQDQRQRGANVVELYHTEVPAKLRGQGIGRQLARGALERAAEANMKLKVTCDYLLDYVNRFASAEQRRSLIVDDRRK